MADGGADGHRHGKREEGEEPVSKHKLQSGCDEWRAEAIRDGRTSLAKPDSKAEARTRGKKIPDQLNTSTMGNHPGLCPVCCTCDCHTYIFVKRQGGGYIYILFLGRSGLRRTRCYSR